ncbi:LysR family transcriptional regulator [Agaribacterium sp. ZY112]|uniref:LysR family transcriptional regulator n=1 Tax=Agaribacterium sp. ZY112 TaxID=3233574 RepID=UPI0035250C8F
MDWSNLSSFLAVAKYGKLAPAARALDINHSTIFRRLKQFEEQLGKQVFSRHNNSYELTDFGREILQHAQGVELAMAKLERSVDGSDMRPSGTIRITTPANIAECFLPEYLTGFYKLYPEIKTEILVGDHHFNLDRREADIAIRANKHAPDYSIAHKLCEVPWRFMVSKAFIKKHGRPTTLSDLLKHPFIGSQGDLNLLPAFRWLEQQANENIQTRANNLNTMSYIAEAGLAVALLPADQKRAELIHLDIDVELEASRWWLISHPDLRNSLKIKLFKQHLIKQIQEDKRLQF